MEALKWGEPFLAREPHRGTPKEIWMDFAIENVFLKQKGPTDV